MGVREIACAALQDLDSLNKAELLSTDSGHNPTNELTAEDVALLDRIAELTEQPDAYFTDLRELFAASAYGHRVGALLSHYGLDASAPLHES